jgi:hypothetical protein
VELEYATNVLGKMLAYRDDSEIDLARALTSLDQVAKRAIQPGTTIANWLSQRGMKVEGDGLTKETAINFPRARSKMEAMENIYEFIAGLEATVISQHLEAFDGDTIIDLITTTKGAFYFRTPKGFL